MSQSYDIEALMFELQDMLKLKLNPMITQIATEKNDGISPRLIGANAWAVQSLDEKVMNYDDYVFLLCEQMDADGRGPVTAEKYTISVVIVSAQVNSENHVNKMFRYLKALKQTIEKNWDSFNSNKIKFSIQQYPPQDLPALNSTKQSKAVAIQLTGSLA